MVEICALESANAGELETLLDAAFGADRKLRTAYMLRKGVSAIEHLSFGLNIAGALAGSIQCWPVQLTGREGMIYPMVLVGPVAVAPDRQNHGLGQKLMNAALEAAAKSTTTPMVMIGDPEYYERFGFFAGNTSGWQLPGPFEHRRLLLRNPNSIILPSEGNLGPAR